jgi:hypothetical protein
MGQPRICIVRYLLPGTEGKAVDLTCSFFINFDEQTGHTREVPASPFSIFSSFSLFSFILLFIFSHSLKENILGKKGGSLP